MNITSNIKPSYSFVRGTPCIITFIENVIDNSDGTWTYDQYILKEEWQVYLQARISANYDEWLQKAKDAEYEAEAEKIRTFRNACLKKIDIDYCNAENWLLMSQASKNEWMAYKQKLRTIPDQPGYPYKVSWPKQPIFDLDREAAQKQLEEEAKEKLLEISVLQAKLKYQTERHDFLEECVAEMASYLYV